MENPKKQGVSGQSWSWILAALLVIAFLYRLGSWGVIDTSEARYAEISRQMYETSDYLHPVYLGIEHYHKPPMTYWITAAAYHVFGVNTFAARFFLQLAFILQLFLIYRISLLLYSRHDTALRATMIYSSFMIVWISVRNLTTDAYLNTFLLFSTWSLLVYLFKNKTTFLYLFALFASFAFLTKITAVFVFIGSLLLYILWQHRGKIKWSWHIVGAGIVAVVIAGSWFYFLQIEGKPVLKYMLYDQSVVRYSSDTFRRSMPVYFYFAAGPLLSFPWFFLVTIYLLKKDETGKKRYNLALFSLCLLLPLIFFSISQSKLLLYVLPAFWVLAILAGTSLEKMSDHQVIIWLRIQSIWIITIFAALLVLPFLDSQYILSTGLMVILAISLITFLIIFLNKSLHPTQKLILLSTGLSISLILMSTHFLSKNEENSSTGKIASEWIVDQNLAERQIYIYDKLAPSFAFHLQKEIALVSKYEKRELQFEKSDDWKNYYYDLDQPDRKTALLDALDAPSVLIARTKRLSQIDEQIVNKFLHKEESGLWTIFY